MDGLPALFEQGARLTWQQLLEQVEDAAAGLWALGVGKDSDVDAVVTELEARGGKRTGGKKGGDDVIDAEYTEEKGSN